VKANATSLSPECRDLLDKIFIADEFKRITLQVGQILGFGVFRLGVVCAESPECRDLLDKIFIADE
jgi:hypothetical protein